MQLVLKIDIICIYHREQSKHHDPTTAMKLTCLAFMDSNTSLVFKTYKLKPSVKTLFSSIFTVFFLNTRISVKKNDEPLCRIRM